MRFAPTPLPILLVGETGTGKEVFARLIHAASGRPGILVDVNCGALPREMVESLLFGHRRGAFTGAVEHVSGFIEQAAAGSLLLDEILSLPMEAQPKLLRVLEGGETRRLGEAGKRRVDFRVIATAQEDLATRLGNQSFRLDLYHRLAGVLIGLPPLRERPEDLVPLAEQFARGHQRRLGNGVAPVLHAHGWPGNVRELRAVIDRASYVSPPGELSALALEQAIRLQPHEPSVGRTAQRVQDHATLRSICAAHGWDRQRIAAALGVSQATLYRRLRAAGLSLRSLSCSQDSHLENEKPENPGIPAGHSPPPSSWESAL